LEKRSWKTEYFLAENMQQLGVMDAKILSSASVALEGSHAPYSRFHVGAALLLEDGQIIQGSNQENASYPLGLCAERTAISAKASLAPHQKILAIGITVRSELKLVDRPAAPCGICRQVLLESEAMQGQAIKVILKGETGPILIFESIQNLMPFHFGADDL
jgi:cytidine deaminase